jgi:hypothetical protein
LGILIKKRLAFNKIGLSKSKISSDKSTSIKVNVTNFKELFDNLTLKIKIDDKNNEYLLSTPSLKLPSLNFPNRNTGDHEIIITPHNIPLNKMTFKITVEVYADNDEIPLLQKNLELTVNKAK